jgi:mannose/fructose/N-acetylgalactosamine-specific phosphotransferase system component IIC
VDVVIAALPLVLLGAVCGLDVVSFPQAMISRPIVAAVAAGALAGDAGAGLVVGAVLELIALETLPIGASRYPEWGSASVVAGALAAAAPAGSAGAMPVAVVAALATAWVGSWSMIALRKWNATRARAHHEELEQGSAPTVVGLQLAGLTADLLRGGLLTLIALTALRPAVDLAATRWAVNAPTSRSLVVGAAATIAVAAVWKVFHATPGTRWLFGAGLLGGLALVVWR